MDTTFKKVYKKSLEVLGRCSLENGALVASNTDLNIYPTTVKDYRYVWPRDAAFSCMAANVAGLHKIPEAFFDWCLERVEGLSEYGVFRKNYSTNGRYFEGAFQPDQNGLVLQAIAFHFAYTEKTNLKLAQLLADGIVKHWDGKSFRGISEDLWEERHAFADAQEIFTFSAAACAKGLLDTIELWKVVGRKPKAAWVKTAKQLKARALASFNGKFFARCHGKNYSDPIIDSSMLFLVWPFGLVKPGDKRWKKTLKAIEEGCVTKDGLLRYPFDAYEGEIAHRHHRKKGAGAWPLLNFEAAIVYKLLGDRRKANKMWKLGLTNHQGFLSEQVKNGKPISILPLAWSHSMFLLAAAELGKI